MNNELENLLHLRSILQQNENFEKLKLINIKIAEILKKTNISDNKKMSDYIFEEMENDLLNDDFSIFRDFDKKQTEKQTENKLKLDDLMSNIDLKQILYSDNESNTISDNNKMEISNNNNAKFEPASNLTTLNLNKNNKLKKSKNSKINGCDDKLVEAIKNEMMDKTPNVSWENIIGLDFQKKSIKEIVIWPILRPDIFTGLRKPPKGILLFGPPGTGKTMIGKAIASEAGAKFFSISASSLTSKWHGEGEKMVRTLFAVARNESPAIIFVDEIDSVLSQRSSGEFEATTRLKTEFLVQLDGVRNSSDEKVLLVGATNRPQQLDEAARRRLSKRLYIPLPKEEARRKMIKHLLKTESANLSEKDLDLITTKTDGYSGADMASLCREAAYGPIRKLETSITDLDPSEVRPIEIDDFLGGLKQIKASVSKKDLEGYRQWNDLFGCSIE